MIGAPRPTRSPAHAPDRAGFACPLRGSCLASPLAPFGSYREGNEAVLGYQTAPEADRDVRAHELYARHLPLVRKTLHRFCHPFDHGSRCYAGACLPEDLVGETYPLFRAALDRYDAARGVDFVGYASRHLFWGLEHRARGLRRARRDVPLAQAAAAEPPASLGTVEERLLARVDARSLLGRLGRDDALLLGRAAAGHGSRELGRELGVSGAVIRKRLQRIRRRLRTGS